MKKGTTLECFEDLMKRLQLLPDFFEKRKLFAGILGVEDQTIRRWISGVSVPYGVSMVSLRSHLDFLGYHVEEFAKLPDVLQDSSRLLAFHVITLDEMIRLSEFDSSSLLGILRGVRGISQEREDRFQQTVDAYRQELATAQSKLVRIIPIERKGDESGALATSVAVSIPALASVPVIATQSRHVARAAREERFRDLTLNLLNFARFYVDESVSEEERDKLRSIVGQRNIFDLKNLLVRLCGSTAYKQTQP